MIVSSTTLRLLKPLVPFVERSKASGMSYGLGPAGYDIRLGDTHIIGPNEFKLASSLERFVMPTNLLGTVMDKSTWARQGLSLFNTVIEPGWQGYLTLELINHGSKDLVLNAGMPIAQIVFHLLDVASDQPYVGKYQDQGSGPQVARFE